MQSKTRCGCMHMCKLSSFRQLRRCHKAMADISCLECSLEVVGLLE